MNKAQLTYAIERVEKSLKEKVASVNAKYTTKAKPVTVADVYKAIKAGSVKVVKGKEYDNIRGYTNLDDVFDLSPLNYESALDDKKAEPEIAKLKKEAESIKDRLMLGDSQEALKLIESFCG